MTSDGWVLPELLLTFYGDDFTGSTDAMEALCNAGVSTVLFVDPPTPDRLERFPHARAVGVTGLSRAMTPREMEDHLPGVFRSLKALRAPLTHYKVCSTFDSSPEIGSIGRAIDLGQQIFQGAFVPLIVGAPALGRYVAFGNLFARSSLGTEPFRIDRHPTMSRHPITPMTEADLRIHLSRQTDRRIALFDLNALRGEESDVRERFRETMASNPEVVLFDTLTEADVERAGALVWSWAKGRGPLFGAGSSGFEYALTAHWRAEGLVSPREGIAPPGEVSRLAVFSGSCSPVTENQIAWALAAGFDEIEIQTERLVDPRQSASEIERVARDACMFLNGGRSVVAHLAKGPDDQRIAKTIDALQDQGYEPDAIRNISGRFLGGALGRILRSVVEEAGLRRVAVTGGDTSGYVAREMGIEALEMAGRMAPGVPLCRVNSDRREIDGLEIAFKGGQLGWPDFFGAMLKGKPERY